MGMGLAGSYGAGAGADALKDLIKQKFLQQIESRRASEAQQHMGLQARGQDDVQGRFDTERNDQIEAVRVKGAAQAQAQQQQAQAMAAFIEANPHMKNTADADALGLKYTDSPEQQTARAAAEQAAGLKQKQAENDITTGGQMKVQAAGHQNAVRLAGMRQPSEGRLVQIQGPNGAPVWVREGDAVGKPAAQAARAVTGAERQTLAYYNRAKDAGDLVGPLEDKIAKMGMAGQAGLQHLPNWMQPSENQSYRQAQRAFTEARLRKESGAAIPTGEYENDSQTYFAQPGDTPATLTQKRKARESVLEGMKFSSGKAFNEFYGDDAAAASAPAGQRPSGGGGAAADPLGLRGKK
jgi:hypothetical protein